MARAKKQPPFPAGYTRCRDLPGWTYAVDQFARHNKHKHLPCPFLYELAGDMALPFEVKADTHLAERAIEIAFIAMEATWWQLLESDQKAQAKRRWFKLIRGDISTDARKTEAELRRRKFERELSHHPELAKLYSEVHGEARHG